MIGQTIGNYVVRDKIGEGGMGVVYVAEHPRIGRKVAIKVLLPEYSQNAEVVARFFTEARASSAIKNEHIIDIIDFGELPDRSSYIIMEWLEGQSLSELIERERALPVERALHIADGIGRALAAAHANGIVHRDLKPDNIFLVSRGDDRDFVKVLDFGIAKLLGDDQPRQSKTQTGAIIGTPMYMSPEQCRGVAVDERSDTYSFGVIVYQMLAGALPFAAEGLGDLLLAHMTETPKLLDAPEPVARAVARALEKDPQKRPPHVSEFVRELTGRMITPTALAPAADARAVDSQATKPGATLAGHRSRPDAPKPTSWLWYAAPIALFGLAGVIFAMRGPHESTPSPPPAMAVRPLEPVSTPTPPAPQLVHVSLRATPATAHIVIDGVTHPNPFGDDVALDANEHLIEMSAPGFETFHTTVRFDKPVDLGRELVAEAQKPVTKSSPKPAAHTEPHVAPTSVETKPTSAPAPEPKHEGPTIYTGKKGTLDTGDPFGH